MRICYKEFDILQCEGKNIFSVFTDQITRVNSVSFTSTGQW